MVIKILLFLLPFLTLFGQIYEEQIKSISTKPVNIQIEELNNLCWKLRSNDPANALKFGLKAIELGESINDLKSQATSHNFVGVVYRNIAQFGEAMKHYQSALQIASSAKDSIQIAYSYNNIGGIYRMQSQFTLALENIFSALSIFTNQDNKAGEAYCMINIGIIYTKIKNWDLALYYLNKTRDIREELGDRYGEALAIHHIAELFYQKGDLEKTMEYYKVLEKSYKKLNDKKGLAFIYDGIASIFYKKNNLSEALIYRKRAITIHKQIQSIEGQVNCLCGIALINAKMKNFNKSIKLFTEIDSLITNNNLIRNKADYLKAYSEFLEISGNYKAALKYLNSYYSLKDSLSKNEDISRISALENIYKTEKMIHENELLQKNVEISVNERNYLFLLSAVSMVFVAVLLVRVLKGKELNKKLFQHNKEKDTFFGILAHDLKNPFNSLLGYSELLSNSYNDFTDEERKESISAIHEATKRLYQLVQNLLDWFRIQNNRLDISLQKVQLEDEINSVVSVFQPIADSKEISIVVKSENLICECDPNILSTILRNLINNALKFTAQNGTITIRAFKNDNFIFVDVVDTGIGMSAEIINNLFKLDSKVTREGTNKEKGSGLGLLLVKELVGKMGGELTVTSEENIGSTFTFSAPIHNN